MSESKAQRKRRLSRARSARYRLAKRQQVERVQGVKFKGMFGAGTMAALEHIRAVCGCRDIEEAITLLARFGDGFARRDPVAFQAAMDPRNPV